MKHGWRWWVRFGIASLTLACSLALARPAAAQQPGARDTTTKTPAERVQQQLRSLRPVAAPDTLLPADTLRASPARVTVEGAGAQAAGPPGSGTIQRDSLMEALAGLTGFVATEYTAEEALFRADSGKLELRRQAVVSREGQRMRADSSIVYDEATGVSCGRGRPTFTGGNMQSELTSDLACYNIHSQVGMAANAETSISQGANWRLKSDDLRYSGGATIFSHDAIFTDCDLPWDHVHYHFGAKEAKVVRNNVLVARSVTLNFADVPVFWLPFMVQSLSRGRRSGVLMPRFGINDIARNSSNYSRRIEDVGVYWAVNDYMGAEVAMDWMSSNYTAIRGSLDYSVTRRFLSGGLTFRRFFPADGGSEFTLSSQNSWQPDERTRLGMTANYSTSAAFVRRRSLDPRELRRSIDSGLNMNRQFDWGSLTLGATRNQYLTDNAVTMTLPSFGLNLSSITLFGAEPGEERWYSNATWTGTINGRRESNQLGTNNQNVNAQSRSNTTSNLSSSFTLGKFGVSQSVSFAEEQLDARQIDLEERDTVISLPDRNTQRTSWSTGINFQQNLIGTTTTLTPSLSLNGELLKNDSSGGRVASPTRLNFAASVQTALYGFWPGVGPLTAIRHRLSPSLSYTYSPAPRADSRQRAVFAGLENVREQNTLTFGVSQTFEGKRRPRADGAPGARDSAGVPAVDSAALAADTASGPRRLPQGEAPIMLLSIATDAVVYDFVAAKEGQGIRTPSISTSLQSDLFRNLQLRFTHDLWRTIPGTAAGEGTEGTPDGREFAPHLSSVNASFSLNSDSWLFRVLGLGRRGATASQTGEGGAPEGGAQADPALDRTRPENGLVGTRRREQAPAGGPRGSWNASLNYTLNRPRTVGPFDSGENQMVTGTFSFQPTELWSLNWATGYNITDGAFTDHMLTLTRRLHDWDANFDFTKVQNGNLSFQFRVSLRANPDIKLDYEQHDLGTLPQQRFR